MNEEVLKMDEEIRQIKIQEWIIVYKNRYVFQTQSVLVFLTGKSRNDKMP